MALPVPYNVRNVIVRWRTTGFTVLGVTLVVAVYVLLQSMAEGIQQSSGNTGDPRNIMVVRKGSTAESSSLITREQFRLIPYLPEIARDAQGRPLVSADVIVLISLPRRDGKGEANVVLRGISPIGMELRPQVKLVQGRWFTPGKREIVVSSRMAGRFANFDLGQSFKTSGNKLTVVGWFDGGGSAFDSEIWMDTDEARSIFDRENYSSVLLRLADGASASSLTNRIETDKRLPLRAEREISYYTADQVRLALRLPREFSGRRDVRRRRLRSHEHDVRQRRRTHARDRHASGARLPAAVDFARFHHRRSVPFAHRGRARLRGGLGIAQVFRHDSHDEFRELQRNDVPVSHHSFTRRERNAFFRSGRRGRQSIAGHPCVAVAGHCRAQGGLRLALAHTPNVRYIAFG